MSQVTEDTREDLASELAYVRSLAEEGRDAPLINGIYYVIWGGLMGLASLLVFFTQSGLFSLGAAGIYGPWVLGPSSVGSCR